MNTKSIFLALSLIFSAMPASAFESQVINWAKNTIVPHIKEGSKVLGADLKAYTNAVASVAKRSMQAGIELGSKGFNGINAVMDAYPRTTTFFGAYAVMLAGLYAYRIQRDQLDDYKIRELEKFARTLDNSQFDCGMVSNLTDFKVFEDSAYHSLQGAIYNFPEKQFSSSVKNALIAFEEEFFSNANFSPSSEEYKNLLTALYAEIDWLRNPNRILTIPFISFALAWGIMAQIACNKDGWPQKVAQKISDGVTLRIPESIINYVKSFPILNKVF